VIIRIFAPAAGKSPASASAVTEGKLRAVDQELSTRDPVSRGSRCA
jgi:hypothetical protein